MTGFRVPLRMGTARRRARRDAPVGFSPFDAYKKASGSLNMTQGMPRRCDVRLRTPAEVAIYAAIEAVENIGADPRLTHAVMSLTSAAEAVGDYIEDELHKAKE